jgi:hypothetical protein
MSWAGAGGVLAKGLSLRFDAPERDTRPTRCSTALGPPIRLSPFCRGLDQEPLIPDLLKVVIVGKRLPYPTVPHHDKRRAIRETEGFVGVPLEHLPGFLFPVRRNTDDSDKAAGTNFFPKFDGDVMPRPM